MPAILKPERALGRTGVPVPLIGYGTAPLGKPHITRDHAVSCLNHAIDLGITYLDTSPDYGSEEHVGEVMRTRRRDVFLATKINNRSHGKVLDELEQSLERLQTDQVDLIQIHAVNAWADLEQALAPDGAIHALSEAQSKGLVRYIGITGHARPDILAEGLRRHPFDSVLVALGIADKLVSAPHLSVLPFARDHGVGVIAMKVLGHGCFQNREAALRFSLGLDGVSMAIVGLKNVEEIDEIVRLANDFRPLREEEEESLIDEVRPLLERDVEENQKQGESSLFWLHDTSVMGWRQHDEPASVRY